MQSPDKLPDQSWKAVVETAHPKEVKEYLIDEIFKAMGIRADSRWRTWFGPIFSPIVGGFAQRAAAFDQDVATFGFKDAACLWLKKWIPGLIISGSEQLPQEGPLLIAANHPGTFDGLAIASTIPRIDLRIVAAANPFFRTLPNTRQYFIYSTRDAHVRMATIRNAIRHLHDGGALLIFPSGRLDPDPLHFTRSARQALHRWSDSLRLLLTKVPEVTVVVAINAGFVASKFLHNPVVQLYSEEISRQKLAEFIQVVQQVVFNHQILEQPRVLYGTPASGSQIVCSEKSFQAQIFEKASLLMENILSSSAG
jgi:hypothetical protein